MSLANACYLAATNIYMYVLHIFMAGRHYGVSVYSPATLSVYY